MVTIPVLTLVPFSVIYILRLPLCPVPFTGFCCFLHISPYASVTSASCTVHLMHLSSCILHLSLVSAPFTHVCIFHSCLHPSLMSYLHLTSLVTTHKVTLSDSFAIQIPGINIA